MNRAKHLRDILQENRPAVAFGVFDGISATLAERAGCDALWASGFCISARKRIPDVGLITMSENLDACREIHNATELPVVADIDDGFGDALNVQRTIRELEASGVAGVSMEDNRHPKRSSLYGGLRRELVSSTEFAGKIAAARDARRADLVLIARTEAIVAGLGVDEALRRAEVYEAAGADMILIHNKSDDPEPVLEVGRRWKGTKPLVAVPTTYPTVDIQSLYECGYRLVIYANQGLRAAVQAMDGLFRKMVACRSLAEVEADIAPLSSIFSLVGLDDVRRAEQLYLKGGA